MSEQSHTRRLGFKLFLEGQEVDLVNFRLDSGIGRPATANISIPSNDEAHRLLPRTLVHLFWYEDRYELGTEARPAKNKAGLQIIKNVRNPDLVKFHKEKKTGKISKLGDYNDLLNWKLLFTGEVIGYGFSKVGGIRSISLSCMDFSSYWNAAQMYWGYKNASSDKKKKAIFVGATRLFQGGKTPVTTRDRLVQVLTAKPNGMLQPEGILGGIVSLLESATGVFNPGMNGQKFRGVNDFMSFAELKYHLTRTIGATDRDNTASVFLNDKLFKKWLYRVGKSINQTASYMQLITSILPHIHYEWNSVLAPPYMPAYENALMQTKLEKIPAKYRGKGDIGLLQKYCTASWNTINSLEDKTSRNREHNRKLPRHYDGVRDLPELDKETNRPKINPKVKATITKLNNASHLNGWKNAGELENAGDVQRKSLLEKAKGNEKQAVKASKVKSAFYYAAQAARLIDSMADPTKATKDNFAKTKALLELARRGAGTGTGGATKTTREKGGKQSTRLHMFLFRPDLYMCPPPKCNVIFPDMVQSIIYSRNWMSEVTRFWLSTVNSRGRDLKKMYFAPNTSILSGTDKRSSEEAVRRRHSFHMRHEKFTGIIPAFESISDWKAMQKAYKQQISGENSGEKIFDQNDHLIRAANFMFFKRRYMARSMRLTLRYSPQLVVGLPCLVLDPEDTVNPDSQLRHRRDRIMFKKTEDADKAHITEKMNSEQVTATGTHFVGVIHSLEHIGDASGGAQTKVVMSHVRTHTEASEIYGEGDDLSNWTYSYQTRRRSHGNVITELTGRQKSNDVYDTDWKKHLGSKYNPKARYVSQEVRDKEGNAIYGVFEADYVSTTGETAENHPRADKGTVLEHSLVVKDGVSSLSEEKDTAVQRVPNIKVRLWSYYQAKVKKQYNFTFEGIVTPPWYAKCFLPDNIGKLYYDDMVGCESVIDDPAIMLSDTMRKQHKDLLDKEAEDAKGEEGETETDFIRIYQNYKRYVPGRKKDESEYVADEELTGNVYVPKSLLQKSKSTRYAAENLAETWLGMKRLGLNINLFMDGYTDRAYANMLDIFGNENKWSYSETKKDLREDYRDPKTNEVASAWETEGFHGYAFGDLEKLEGLDGAGERLVGADLTSKVRKSIGEEIDTRKEKFQRVMAYRLAMKNTSKGDG